MIPINWMQVFLAIAVLAVAVSFWRAHKNPEFEFSAFDLIMENNRISRLAFAFMSVLGVTTWIMIDLQVNGKMTEGYLGLYGTMWVFPLVAKVVFNQATMPSSSELQKKPTTSEVE